MENLTSDITWYLRQVTPSSSILSGAACVSDFLGQALSEWRSFVVPVLLLYLILVQALRFRREDGLKRRFSQYSSRAGLATMTDNDAQAIIKTLLEYEFTTLYQTSLEFALFKTYGIESIARLLVATRQLVHEDHRTKR